MFGSLGQSSSRFKPGGRGKCLPTLSDRVATVRAGEDGWLKMEIPQVPLINALLVRE